MPLLFVHFCNLLADLEAYSSSEPSFPTAERNQLYRQTIIRWIRAHKVSINSPTVDAVVVLSSLFPARRTDRVYSIQVRWLSKALRRCLSLGEGRWQLLDQWMKPGRGDLGDCVERVQRQAENAVPIPGCEVTLEEIDVTLRGIAKACRFSAPSVNATGLSNDMTKADALKRVYVRLQSREAKWFTRLILKDYGSLELNEPMVLSMLDFRLPTMIKRQDSFESAVHSLRGWKETETLSLEETAPGDGSSPRTLTPKTGIKVGRTTYMKGRSIRHAVGMIHGRTMSVERKYDGEYCQIHIDRSKGECCIQIFSKSGKDSTNDKEAMHQPIKDALRIGQENCGVSKNCILEGEMVLWSDRENKILPFHKIRKHVSRSGSFLGTRLDSQPHPHEHLMIYFYDVMLIDDAPVLDLPHAARRCELKRLVTPRKGRAQLVERQEVQFDSPRGPKRLQEILAHAFVNDWEGLVLKPSHEPYFRAFGQPTDSFASCWIKLKKDYIAGLGDTADLAIVGAGYSASESAKRGKKILSWTHFHIGCLTNKKAVISLGAKPHFVVVDALNACITLADIVTLNQYGQFRAMPLLSDEAIEAFTLDVLPGVSKPSVAFREPFVFEVMGSGFDKQPNQKIYTLRFPRVLKIHWDRSWKEAVSLDELQDLASKAIALSSQDDAPVVWVERLEQVDKRSNGDMTPWYDSQDEAELEPPVVGMNSRAIQRTANLVAPPMVRIDTKEMTATEQLMAFGDAGESSLSNFPTTLPEYSQAVRNSRQQSATVALESQGTSRKRAAASRNESKADVAVKKARFRSPSIHLPEKHTSPAVPSSLTHHEPLQPIANVPAGPRITPSIKPAKSRNLTELLFVRKMAAGSQRGPTRFKKIVDASSPERETTASECSTGGPSQLTECSPTSSSIKAKSPEHIAPAISPASHSKRPSSSESRNSPGQPTIRIPSLARSKFILSPCLEGLSDLRQTLLQSAPGNVLPFPSLTSTSPPLENTHPRDIVLLVESGRELNTANQLNRLVVAIPRGKPAAIAVWDWRLVKDLTRWGSGDREGREVGKAEAKRRFFCRMEWLAAGGIEVRWQDGRVTRVPEGSRGGAIEEEGDEDGRRARA